MSSTTIPSQAEIDAYIGYRLIDTCIFFIVFETVCVGLRIASRRLTKTPLGIDDILVIPAFLFCVSVCGVGIAMVKYGGTGRHADALAYTDPEKLVTLSKLIIALTCVYLWSATLPKLVILALYLRIFTTNLHRRIIYILGGIIIANLVANFIVGLNQCTPFAYNWDTTIPGGHCINRVAYFEFASLANILTDLAMLVLPLRIVWKLHAGKATKLGLSAIFLTGSIGLITSIIRFSAFSAEDVFTDISWATVDLTIWTLVEPGTYLIAGCLPTFRPLILWAMGRQPDSQTPAKQTPMSASTARRARIWLDRVFERTERLRDEDDDEGHNGSNTVTANMSFTKPKGSQYSAHAEPASQDPASIQHSTTDSRNAGTIHVEHELMVYSSQESR